MAIKIYSTTNVMPCLINVIFLFFFNKYVFKRLAGLSLDIDQLFVLWQLKLARQQCFYDADAHTLTGHVTKLKIKL